MASGDRLDVTWTFMCEFGTESDDQSNWDFTYQARHWNPNNQQINYHSAWVSQKPSFSSSLGTQLSDPIEGTYRCTVDWWADEYYLGQGEATVQVSYTVPTGETTESGGWWEGGTSAHKWNQTLTGGSFVGRQVTEQDGGGGNDTCWFPGSRIPKGEAVTGGSWPVKTNKTEACII